MNNDKIYSCKIKLNKIFYPKNVKIIKSGEFGIFSAKVILDLDDGKTMENKNIKLKGTCCTISYYEEYKVKFKLSEHSDKWGDTYEIISINTVADLSNISDQKKFLMSVVNETTVNALFDKFDDVIDLLENEKIDKLITVKGIKVAKAMRLIQKYKDTKDYSKIYVELGSLGLTDNFIKKAVKTFGTPEEAIKIIKENPYELVNIDGIGFKKADEIAYKLGIANDSPFRVKGCMLNILKENWNLGRSYLHYSELINTLTENIGYVDSNIILSVAQGLSNSGEIVLTENNTMVGLKSGYELEQKIANELIRLIKAKSKIKIDIDTIEDKIKKCECDQGFNFTEEQKESILKFTQNNILTLTGAAGCVDCDTEYFNGYEWKKISNYEIGDKVLQYTKDGYGELVTPSRYIKNKQDYLWHFETKYGLDQCLSGNHRVIYETSKGNLYENTMDNIKKMHESSSNGFSGKFYTTFKYSGKGVNLTDEEIKVMCAVICEGNFSDSYSDKNTCRIRLKKIRKQEELEKILNEAQIKYKKTKCLPEGFFEYIFHSPRKEKVFSKYWYSCSDRQLKIITDNILKWDGCLKGNRKTFSTTSKETADFIQFAFSSQGYRCTINITDRVGNEHLTNGKTYIRKSIEYTLIITNRNKISMGGFHRDNENKTKINKYKTIDGYEYCFTVPSGMLILRRNNKIFITGNCGKSVTMRGMYYIIKDEYNGQGVALSGKAAVRITEATTMESTTIHKLLEWNTGEFTYNSKNKLDIDYLFVDECTMINGELFLNLLQSLPDGCKVVFAGDIQQLTPIGSCQVFKDMLESDVICSSRLTKPHRQALKSGIIPLSIDIINQEQQFKSSYEGTKILGELQDMELIVYKEYEYPSEIVINKFMEYYNKYKDIMETQVIVPMKYRGDLSTYNINTKIQEIINPITANRKHIVNKINKDLSYTIQINDKVINMKNNYKTVNTDGEETPIFNGNIGIVTNIEDDTVTVNFDEIGEIVLDSDGYKNLELAYACTIHKYQGSGSKYVICAVDSSAYVMLNSEMLYTMITRAKKYCTLIAKNSAMRKCISNREIKNKQTYLKNIINTLLTNKLQ